MEQELETSDFYFLAMGATDKKLIVIIRITFVKVNLSKSAPWAAAAAGTGQRQGEGQE